MPRIVAKARQLRLERALKLNRPLSAKEVAVATGIHQNTITKIERGISDGIRYETLLALCQYYGVGIADVLKIEEVADTKTPTTPQ